MTDSLATLLDHSMVSPASRPGGEQAFRLLDVIRRFASGRLEDRDEMLSHLESHLLDVLGAAGLRYGSQDWARRRLDSERLNLQAVLGWIAARGRPAGPLLRRIGDVWVWLLIRGLLRQNSELRERIESWPAAELEGESDQMARHWLTVQALVDDGRYTQAGALIDEILPDARRLEQPSRWGLMLMVRALSRPYAAGSPARAEFEEALAVVRGTGDQVILGYVLSHFGLFLCVDGDVTRARGLHQEMLRNARSLGDDNQRAEAHYDLAVDALSARDPEPAQPHLAAAAQRYSDIDNREGLARCLGALSGLALEHEHTLLAARLIGATAAARAIGLTPWPSVAEAERRTTEQIKASLPNAEFTAQVASGQTETAEATLAQALSTLGAAAPPGTR